jgi:hypothetical protein
MRRMKSFQILIGTFVTVVLVGGGETKAQQIASDNFDNYTSGLSTFGSVGNNSNPTWSRRGDTSAFDLSNGQVVKPSLTFSGSATAYYAAHTHTTEPILRAEIDMTIPSTSPSGTGGSFWGQILLGLHQSPTTSGGTFPSTANAYFLRIRGNQDFNLEKYDGANAVLAGQPAPAGDPGGGGWTNFNGFATSPSNHNAAAGNLALDIPYILAIERDATTSTVSASITRKSDSVVVGQGSFVDPGVMHSGDHVSILLQGGGGGGSADSYILDNFTLSVPEPSSLVLVVMSGLALIGRRRRR